jgi:hypothetical protein
MYDTKLTAHLPGLDIEIARRELHGGAGESVTISLRAMPDLATAMDRLLPGMAALLTASLAPGNSSGSAVLMPVEVWRSWMEATQAAWAPWMALNPFLAAWLPDKARADGARVDEGPGSSPP